MSVRAVIFDRDGVLTRFDFAAVMRLFEGVEQASFGALWERWHAYYGSATLPRTPAEETSFLAAFWNQLAEAWALPAERRESLLAFDYTRTIHPFADARPAMLAAKARGLRIGVLSNFPLVTLEGSLVSAGLMDLVDVARSASVIGASKPDPAAYWSVLDALGVHPEECLMVDDEEPCVLGARALGIRTWLVDRTGRREDALPDLSTFEAMLRDMELEGGESDAARA